MFAGVALILSTLAGGQQIDPPAADPRLTAVLTQPARSSLIGDLGVLAADGVPGADALHRGFLALLSDEEGPGWAQACRIWESAAATSAEAAHFTAECMEHGHDRPADAAGAADLYRLAGEGGFPKSLCALGNLHMAGTGVSRDTALGAQLCRRGAEAGDADAQTDLANFYLSGQGVAEDKLEARRWYERAAEQNQRNALFTLGQMYWYGDTVEKDPARAIGLWERSWNAGRRDAALMLARAYVAETAETRQTAPLDHAMRWYDLALPHIDDPAEKAKAEREREAMRVIRASGDAY